MSAVKYKKLCTKCKKYYTPYNSPISRQGVCRDCRISKSKCGAINELGYQCQNEIEFFGWDDDGDGKAVPYRMGRGWPHGHDERHVQQPDPALDHLGP